MGAAAAPLVPRGLILGVGIVLVGLVFLADSLSMLDVASGWAIWPIAVIVAGVAIRLQPGVASQVFGVVLIVAGVWLLFNAIGMWTYSFWKTWPLILILVGAWIRYQSWRLSHLENSSQAGAVALLSQVTSQSGQGVRGGELTAIAGDGLLDFGDVVRGADPAVVNVLAIAGRIRVAVPIGWNVDMRVLAVPGRVSDTRSAAAAATPSRVDLIVRGTAMLGIVEIVPSTGAPLAAHATV